MRIAIRAGHNNLATGAIGILSEVTENRKIYASVIKYLKLDGNEVLDVTPGECLSPQDLFYGVNKANTFKADIFASIHLNAGGGHGTEVFYYSSSSAGNALATRVCNSMANLGFTNRGAKSDVRGLYELKYTSMPAIIVECFFCDSAADVVLYQKLGVDKLGKAIAEGIAGHEIKEVGPIVPNVNYILEFQKFYNKTTETSNPILEDGLYGPQTLQALNTITLLVKGDKN